MSAAMNDAFGAWANAGGQERMNKKVADEMFEQIFGKGFGQGTTQQGRHYAPDPEPRRAKSPFAPHKGETEEQAAARIQAEVAMVMKVASDQKWTAVHECQKFGRETLHRFLFKHIYIGTVEGQWEINAARALVRAADALSDTLQMP